MNKAQGYHSNNKGFVLVFALLILMVLSFIGIMATRSTITELMVSGNDKVHKQTFYQADGGTELAQHLLFNNSICSYSRAVRKPNNGVVY